MLRASLLNITSISQIVEDKALSFSIWNRMGLNPTWSVLSLPGTREVMQVVTTSLFYIGFSDPWGVEGGGNQGLVCGHTWAG